VYVAVMGALLLLRVGCFHLSKQRDVYKYYVCSGCYTGIPVSPVHKCGVVGRSTYFFHLDKSSGML